jgi:hypothetical protein
LTSVSIASNVELNAACRCVVVSDIHKPHFPVFYLEGIFMSLGKCLVRL